jgi:hypothetical protein
MHLLRCIFPLTLTARDFVGRMDEPVPQCASSAQAECGFVYEQLQHIKRGLQKPAVSLC